MAMCAFLRYQPKNGLYLLPNFDHVGLTLTGSSTKQNKIILYLSFLYALITLVRD